MSSRKTLSFYRYCKIPDPDDLRVRFREDWSQWSVLGRTYLSQEGINAQVSVPEDYIETFRGSVEQWFPGIPFKIAIEEKGQAFKKLHIKVRPKIVADGLDDQTFDPGSVGQHLTAKEFNDSIDDPNTIVVDMRNHYECEVGHFERAYLPKANTFREAIPEVTDFLKGKEDKKILLYCTGGIRCEKASAWLKHQGFENVHQLHGGIIDYARQIKRDGLESRFKGINFVFDDRIGERITEDVLANCHQCGSSCDRQVNCRYPGCNRLLIQCHLCETEFDQCCSLSCQEIMKLPREEQIRIQNETEKQSPKFLRSRQRLRQEEIRKEFFNAKVT